MTVEERIKMQRDQKLIELGYCIREYCGKDDKEADFPLYDEDKMKFYRLVADEVTDEQFQRILAIGGARKIESSNKLADVFTILAWFGFVILCLAGVAVASSGHEFNAVAFFTMGGIGAGCLLSLLWFAEVLKLLQRIHDKL